MGSDGIVMSDQILCSACQERSDEGAANPDGLTLVEEGRKESLNWIQPGNWTRSSIYRCEDCHARWSYVESQTGALFEHSSTITLLNH